MLLIAVFISFSLFFSAFAIPDEDIPLIPYNELKLPNHRREHGDTRLQRHERGVLSSSAVEESKTERKQVQKVSKEKRKRGNAHSRTRRVLGRKPNKFSNTRMVKP